MGLPQRRLPPGLRPADRPRALLDGGGRPVTDAFVDRDARKGVKPSDHAPVVVEFDWHPADLGARTGCGAPRPSDTCSTTCGPTVVRVPCWFAGSDRARRATLVARRGARRAHLATMAGRCGRGPRLAPPRCRAASGAASGRAGWVISIASPTALTPDFAYPFASGDELTTANVEDLQQLTYRPLYFFGGSRRSQLDASLPRSRRRPSTTPRTPRSPSRSRPGRRWSDGEPVTAAGRRRVAQPAGGVPRHVGGLPRAPADRPAARDPRRPARASPSAVRRVTLSLAAPVNPTWFTDSELSQITPLPAVLGPLRARAPPRPADRSDQRSRATTATSRARRRTRAATRRAGSATATTGRARRSSTRSGTSTVVPPSAVAQAQRCVDVVELFRSMAFDTADYTTPGTDVAAAWGTSDGPWRLATFHRVDRRVHDGARTGPRARPASGPATLLLLRAVRERRRAARRSSANGLVDQGTLPLADAPPSARSPRVRRTTRCTPRATASRSSPPWSTSYMPYNFASTRGRGGARRTRVLPGCTSARRSSRSSTSPP